MKAIPQRVKLMCSKISFLAVKLYPRAETRESNHNYKQIKNR